LVSEPTESAVRFEVLGALRASRDGSALKLGSLQQRVVLGVLLLHANRPVGREQVIEAVWGSAAPTYAVNLLQKHVSGLRRALDPARSEEAASQLLAWTDGGYLLTVAAGDLDLDVFDRELARARGARAANNLSAAAEALRTALEPWRGPAFDGLVSPLLDAQREWLAERWIGAVEDRIDVDLALARANPADVVTELRQLIADHPVRERLRLLLMLALYRSNRQAEALAAFQDARTYLREDLGIEPAEPLQRLHQQILATDPNLAAPAAADPPVAVAPEANRWQPAPAQLPHSLPYFTGRDAETARLHELATVSSGAAGSESVMIVAITGPAGVGKTAMAVHWAHQVSGRFPDGQLYMNLRGFDPSGSVVETGDAMRDFLEALGVPAERVPTSLNGQSALYRSVLAGRRVLVVLDNARDADHVRALLPGAPGSLVVVTSRNQLSSLVASDGAYPLVLDLLSTAEARELLARRLGLDRVTAEPRATDDIIASCARLPLALAIVAARAATRPDFALAVQADELRKARGGLDAFDGEDPTTNARVVFSWSYQQLSDDAARLFRLLGLHPAPDLAARGAASLAGVPIERLRPALAELTRTHLVTERAPDRFAVHDLLRAYAAEQAYRLDTDSHRQAAISRMFCYYLHTAYAATRLLDPHRDPITIEPIPPGTSNTPLADGADALAWFNAEHTALLAVLEAARGGFDALVWQLAWTLVTFHDRQGLWHDSTAAQRAGLEAAERLGDRLGQAVTSRSLARACAHLGRHDEAHRYLRHALYLFGELGHLTGQADTHFNFARLAHRQGRNDEALGYARRALDLYSAADNPAGQAAALNAVGWFHVVLGDPNQALTYCREALTLHRELGERTGTASTLDSLGYAHHHLGHYDRAIACYEEAIDLWRDLGDRYNEADTLTHLGDTHHDANQPDRGRQAWQRALTILDELGHADAEQVRSKLNTLNGPDCGAGHGLRLVNTVQPH
jgi:DNA-binding SARP family transcriptional activator/Tfp pilus assembly protein PilF